MRVCVYCASSARAPKMYGDAAFELGQIFARNGVTVLFGGGGVGSMGRLADGVHAAGGEIIGVMPNFMRELEWAHPRVQSYVWTQDMAERKAKLIHETDAVVALPGGSGTFEEVLEVITLKRLGIYLKPIIILNQGGFYEPLKTLFQRSVEEKFMDERHLQMFTFVNSVQEVLDAIRQAPRWSAEARKYAALK